MRLLQLIIGLLACLGLASALPGLFPRNKITTWEYYADVKTGNIEPAPFASQFVIAGYMHVTPEIRDPNLKNAFYVVLNVTHAIRNGKIQHFKKIMGNTAPIPEAAKALNDPFIITFYDNGKVKSLMTNKDEAGWSQNMKRSIASILQLDLSSMNLETPIPPHSFMTKEHTIYGECAVTYDVHRTLNFGEFFTVTKIMDPMSCDKFNQHTFNYRPSQGCMVDAEEEMTSASRRVYHIQKTGEDLLIKTLVAHGVINYFPWKAQSEAHYILANQTMEFVSMMPVDSMTLPQLNMEEMMTLNDVAFQRSRSLYAVHAGVDPTHGRHIVNLDGLFIRLIGMLEEAVNYMNENNLEMTSPEMKHGQTMNRISHIMTMMNISYLEQVFDIIKDETSPRGITMKKLFLNTIPYVGTTATCLFTLNIIREKKIPDLTAIIMLTKLPYNIREPTDSLLIEMEDLMRLGNDTSLDVRKAGILCFATMIHKTHEHDSYFRTVDPGLVKRYVQYYYDHVMSETTYEMKMVFVHGMRNIDMGGVHNLLESIISGEHKISERPDHLRLNAMLVNWRKYRNIDYIHRLYWPILSNKQLPSILRMCAYSILIKNGPRIDRLMSLYWFMVYENNEHVYNYHYTTMKSLANTVNPCLTPLKEMARKLMRFIRVRPVSGIMSGVWITDFVNKEFGFGESVSVFTAADEHTGLPIGSVIDFTSIYRRKPVNDFMLWMRIEGVDGLQISIWNITLEKKSDIPMKEIESVLRRASEDMPGQKPVHFECAIFIQGCTVLTKHYSKIPDASGMMEMIDMARNMKFNWQELMFDEQFTMQVPNDLGLPSLLNNKIPRLISIQANNEITSKPPSQYSAKLGTAFQDWRHGYHSMDVYNPILDTWHGIRRVSAYDVSLSINMNIAYNKKTEKLKINLPSLPLTPGSISGMRSYANNYVMMMDSEHRVLKQYCGNCRQKLVTKGPEHRRNTTYFHLDSKETGLRLSMYEYDCERVMRSRSRCETSNEMMNREDKNTWDSNAVLSAMILRENYLYGLINPELGTCGYLMRMEPSIMYPISEVDITMQRKVEVPNARINLHGTLNSKSAVTNISAQSWTMDATMSKSKNVIDNRFQLQMMRKTPGEKDLKICINGYKIYPASESDPLSRDSATEQEIIGYLNMTMGESENEGCVHDGLSVVIHGKAEMSDEQKEAVDHEMLHGMCQKDIENSQYMYNESSIVPRTPACLREAVLRTTLRKSSYTVIHKNIPVSIVPTLYEIADNLRCIASKDYTYHPEHTEPGKMKIVSEYPLNDETLNLMIRTPTHEERYIGIEGMDYLSGSDPESTRFSKKFLGHMKNKRIKYCVIYPEILRNADGAVMPFIVPSEWTLLSGNYITRVFSVFVKRVESKKLALLMSVANHTLEVIPSDGIPRVIVDGNFIEHVHPMEIPVGSNYPIRITWSHKRLVVKSTYTSFDLEWTERSITLVMKTKLQGKVTGLCGQLDGTHVQHMAKVYSFGS